MRATYRKYFKWFYSILFLIFVICSLFINQKFHRNYSNSNVWDKKETIPSIIDRIQDIPILDQKYQFNITYEIIIDDIPHWINRYKISYLFNFFWFQTGGYKWHLQQMIDLKHISKNRPIYSSYNQTSIFDYLDHHPESGVIIDTAPDPFQSMFSSLPQTGSPTNELCNWYPCFQRKSSSIFQPLITYALYNVIIGNSSSKRIHYDEIIYLFDNQFDGLNQTFFVTQILPRFIRLLALVPQSSVILSPYFNPKKKYVTHYLNILIERKIIHDKKRLIKYHASRNYHAYVVYSTSSPRSDLILLHHILTGNQSTIERKHILIIRNRFDQKTYDQIVQIINQFDVPMGLHIHQYNEKSLNSEVFRQAMIVIGMSSHTLSHIVWCLPGTQIIEIGYKTITREYYEISLQLKLDYWLTMIMNNKQIDPIDFRNVILKVFTRLS